MRGPMKQPSSSCHNFCQIIKLDSQCSLHQANDAESTQIQSVPHREAMDGVIKKMEPIPISNENDDEGESFSQI